MTLLTIFFVINGKGSYSLILSRDWIHANCCVPSTMHQCLIQCHEDDVEMVHVDDSISIAIANLVYWELEDFEFFLASYGKEASLKLMMKANNRSKQSALKVCFNG